MSKVYPTSIRTFPAHKDGRDFVLAADVNEIQDELTGVETVLGAKPQVYTDAVGKRQEYKDVVSRLDAMQRYDDQVATTVNSLVDASNTGWNLPVGTVRDTGTVVPPAPDQIAFSESDWHPMTWNRKITEYPPIPLFPWLTSSPNIVCPKTGWWIITMRVIGQIPSGPASLDHICYARMWLSDHGFDLTTGQSTNPRGTPGHHRLSITYAGEWYQGERLQLQVRHLDSMRVNNRKKYPNPVPSINVTGWAGLTYIRALPNAFTSRPIEDVDPL
ncbi:hypothetical protein [Streptomyces sp. NPDC004528]|uniref:hypothetical protein n=1 Tax=Streptomyces sp. NPDC004528 TaxID=3154550 RepID=UPI0033B0F651